MKLSALVRCAGRRFHQKSEENNLQEWIALFVGLFIGGIIVAIINDLFLK